VPPLITTTQFSVLSIENLMQVKPSYSRKALHLHAGFWWRKEPHSRWEDNIEMEFIGQGGDGVDWINMSGDRQVAYCFEHCNKTCVPYKAG